MIPKFRAWVKEDKEMWPVHAIVFDNKTVWVEEPDDEDPSGLWEFDDVILMQSTGLKDKNGKEIFEGDILSSKDGLLNGVVEYRYDLGMWTNSLIRYNNFERLCNVARDREIIGNIYKNPELLK